jgi:hypothetical protein
MGGSGGDGSGGGIDACTSSLTLNNVNLTSNIARGGCGGAVGNSEGAGSAVGGISISINGDGQGGDGWGGGLSYMFTGTLAETGGTVSGNSAIGGNGGSGYDGVGVTGKNGNNGAGGGNGGSGEGGGFYLSCISAGTISPALCSANTAQGGNGGNGGKGAPAMSGGKGGSGGSAGSGGNATGGGMYLYNTTVTISGPLTSNVAHGGNGGAAGLGGLASYSTWPFLIGSMGTPGSSGDGGSGSGGGAYVDGFYEIWSYGKVDTSYTPTLNNANVSGNTAIGGLLGSGKPSGTNGVASGGGVYVVAGGTIHKTGSTSILNNSPNKVGP